VRQCVAYSLLPRLVDALLDFIRHAACIDELGFFCNQFSHRIHFFERDALAVALPFSEPFIESDTNEREKQNGQRVAVDNRELVAS
jgi:hypothetical protein